MSRGRIVVVVGTRPDFIKVGPVVAALTALNVAPTVINTGQHTTLLDDSPAKDDLSGAVHLHLSSDGDVAAWEAKAIPVLEDVLTQMKPVAACVVQGDTMTAKCAAIAARSLSIPVAHIEAGLRSHRMDSPWPEEENRVLISTIADWHYAPTIIAAKNLLAEGVPIERIHRTGNTAISAIERYASTPPHTTYRTHPTILITLHRREIADIHPLMMAAEQASSPEIRLLWPVHPRFGTTQPANATVHYIHPLSYVDTIGVVRSALGVITDSGGLQEECGYLGVPCCVLRDASDRPESLNAGTAKLLSLIHI